MSKVIVAETPDLSFIFNSHRTTQPSKCQIPLIIKNGGRFDWEANAFLVHIGGGANVYNIKPLASTIVKKAYSLNLFCSHLENEKKGIFDTDDGTLYNYVNELRKRSILDYTIIKHVRLALEYIEFTSKSNPEKMLATNDNTENKNFKVNYSKRFYSKGYFKTSYLTHHCLNGLINISTDVDFIRDYELEMWLNSINCTTYHPVVSDFLRSRWQAFTTLLDMTGSRITEVHKITRTMIKDAAANILDTNKRLILRDIPVLKGKYKGKTREIETNSDDIQIVLWHITMVEKIFPHLNHDAIFVDSRNGSELKPTYLKNYAKKVINGSLYCSELNHLTNHSFRHRFITLTIAKSIKKLAESGSFHNILTVAANACRKITMHASNSTLARYIHLAQETNNPKEHSEAAPVSTHIKIRLNQMLKIAENLDAKKIGDKVALDSLLTELAEIKKFKSIQIS